MLRDDRAERIEVDADEVERLDLLLVERLEVVGAVASREDAAVDARVQRLHASAEQLGRVRHVLDARDLHAVLLEERGRPAAGDDLEAELLEPAARTRPGRSCRERRSARAQFPHDPGQQPVLHGMDPLDERRPRLDRDGLLADDGTAVEALVDVVHRHARGVDAGRERVVDRMRARKLRQQRRSAR